LYGARKPKADKIATGDESEKLSQVNQTTVANTPRAYARHFRSPDEYAAVNGLAGIRMNGAAARDFKAHLAMLEVNGVRIRRGEATIGLNLTGQASDNHIFTFATRPAETRLMCGREVSDAVLFHPRPNEVMTTRTPSNAPFPWGSIVVSYEIMARVGPGVVGRDVAPARTDAVVLRTALMARARLLRLIEDAARLAETTPEIADSPAAAQALSGVLIEALVDCLSGGGRERDRAAVRRHHQIMARLETVLETSADTILSMPDLCTAAGASERTLHEVCMEFVGMAPMRYVRTRRLAAVREALLTADPRMETVSDIAMRHGFWEVTRFSGAYREAFGETPSATLRRGFA
jgi:AraC-like DNA-binding protein